MTRRIVLSLSVTADGFFEGPGADISWGRTDDELHRHFNDLFRGAGAFLEGRVTYEQMQGHWSTADDDPDASAVTRDFAGIWRSVPKVVYSRTLREVGPGAVLEREVDPVSVRAMAQQPGGDLVLGGPDLAATFVRHGLLDEVRLYVHPVVIGQGRRVFADDARLDLTLLESRTFGCGVVLLRYACS